MICNENIHRITKILLIVSILFHLSFAKDEIVQRSGDGDAVLQFSATGKSYNGDEARSTPYHKPEGQYYKTVFFVVLGIGLAIFVGLLIVCNKVATEFDGINTSSGATVHPPNSQDTYNTRGPDDINVPMSYVNSAYSSGLIGRNEVDRSGADRPPDYSTVADNDAFHRNATFPQVVTTHIETPPPKYEDGAPVFK